MILLRTWFKNFLIVETIFFDCYIKKDRSLENFWLASERVKARYRISNFSKRCRITSPECTASSLDTNRCCHPSLRTLNSLPLETGIFPRISQYFLSSKMIGQSIQFRFRIKVFCLILTRLKFSPSSVKYATRFL